MLAVLSCSRSGMRLDGHNELERQLAAAEQRQSAPVGAVQRDVDPNIRTPYCKKLNGFCETSSRGPWPLTVVVN